MTIYTLNQFKKSLELMEIFEDQQLKQIAKNNIKEQIYQDMAQKQSSIMYQHQTKPIDLHLIGGEQCQNYLQYLMNLTQLLGIGAQVYFICLVQQKHKEPQKPLGTYVIKLNYKDFKQKIINQHVFSVPEIEQYQNNISLLNQEMMQRMPQFFNKDEQKELLNHYISTYLNQQQINYVKFLYSNVDKLTISSLIYYIYITCHDFIFPQISFQQFIKKISNAEVFSKKEIEICKQNNYVGQVSNELQQKYNMLCNDDEYIHKTATQCLTNSQYQYYDYLKTNFNQHVSLYFMTLFQKAELQMLHQQKDKQKTINSLNDFVQNMLRRTRFTQQQQVYQIVSNQYPFKLYQLLQRSKYSNILTDAAIKEQYKESLFDIDKEYYEYLQGFNCINFSQGTASFFLVLKNNLNINVLDLLEYIIGNNQTTAQPKMEETPRIVEMTNFTYQDFKNKLIEQMQFNQQYEENIVLKDHPYQIYQEIQQNDKMNQMYLLFQKIMCYQEQQNDIFEDSLQVTLGIPQEQQQQQQNQQLYHSLIDKFITFFISKIFLLSDEIQQNIDKTKVLEYCNYLINITTINYQNATLIFYLYNFYQILYCQNLNIDNKLSDQQSQQSKIKTLIDNVLTSTFQLVKQKLLDDFKISNTQGSSINQLESR